MVPVTFYQFNVVFGKIEENLKKLEKIIPHIPKGGLFALPEMFCCGFDYQNMKKLASKSQTVLDFLRNLSKTTQGVVVATIPLEKEGKLYNTAVVFDRGTLAGTRGKIELFPIYKETQYFAPAPEEDNRVFQTSVGKVGIVICFEVRFNKYTNLLRKEGAEILIIPAMWGIERRVHFKTLTHARAVETQSFVVAVNAWGQTAKTFFGGASAVYGPWGEILTYAEDGESLATAWVDVNEVHRVRKKIPINL